MNPSLNELQRIAELEFSTIVVDSQLVGEKLRLYISDESLIDVWVARKRHGADAARHLHRQRPGRPAGRQ